MGYRHSLYIVEKDKLNNIKEDILNTTDSKYDIMDSLGAIEILELGKYSDEGFELCENGIKVEGLLAKAREQMFFEGDTQFEFLEPEQLIWLAEKYKERTVNHWKKLLSENEPVETYGAPLMTVEEKCMDYVKDLLHWERFLLDTDKENKFSLQTTWKYEYEMFNIIHCYKSIDWDKYYLFIIGG